MTPAGPTDDSFDPALLSKADALIRRNRPDGVSSDAEELPLLTEAVDDLPELTDALATVPGGLPAELVEDLSQEVSMDLESDDVEEFDLPGPEAERTPVLIGFSQDQLDEKIREAVDHARAEYRVLQARAVQAAIEQGREEALLAQQDYLAEVRREALQMAMMQVSERIIELDSFIAQALDAWVSRELPAIVAGQMDSMVERIRAETTAHMRATLLPELSDKVADLLDSVSLRD